MFIDVDAPKSPRRRRISGVYSIESQRKRRRRDAVPIAEPPKEEGGHEVPIDAVERRRCSDAGHLAAALRQLGRGATVLQIADDALSDAQMRVEELRRLARNALRPDLSIAHRVADGARFAQLATETVALVGEAIFDEQTLLGPTQPSVVLTLGRVELPLRLVDLSLVPRGFPALSLSSPIGAEAAAAVCATSAKRIDEGLVTVARLRQDVARIVDGYRVAQRAIRSPSVLPPSAEASGWPPPYMEGREAEAWAAEAPSRAVRCQSSSNPDDVLHRLR